MSQSLPADKTKAAMSCIAAWRTGADGKIACPVCGAPGLDITDRSARPHTEWYALSCAACGLETAIGVPLGAPVVGSSE